MSAARTGLRLLKAAGTWQSLSASQSVVCSAASSCNGSALATAQQAFRSLATSSLLLAEKSQAPGTSGKPSTSSEQPQQQQASSSSGPSAEEIRLKQVLDGINTAYSSVKAGFETAKSTAASAASAASSAAANLGSAASSSGAGSSDGSSSTAGADTTAGASASAAGPSFMEEIQATLRPLGGVTSATKKYNGPVADGADYTGTMELMIVKQQETAWQKTMRSLNEKMAGIPFLKNFASVKVTDTSVYRKGQELVEDLKEKYETSDHPAVHKVEEVKERFTTGSEATRAMREVRTRDPNFDMNRFVQSVKFDAPVVTKAFLTHDLPTLKDHCGPELIERFSGIFKHFADQGLFEDPTILYVGEVEIVEVRLVDDDPFIIAQFNCQQLKCTRDKFGNVVEGAADQIQRVYYFWGLQMEKSPVVTAEGNVLPVRWVIKDMMWQSMLALV